MILIGGCSWSMDEYVSRDYPDYDPNYKKWYEYIQTDQHVVSYGMGGAGNVEITNTILSKIYTEKDVTQVIIAMSNWLRFSLFGIRFNPQIMLKHSDYLAGKTSEIKSTAKQSAESQLDYVKLKRWHPNYITKHSINNTFTSLMNLTEICKARRIKLSVFQMLNPSSNRTITPIFNHEVTRHPLANILFIQDYAQIVGFPFTDRMGGFTIESYLKSRDDYEQCRIGKNDAHPSGHGHKVIGDWVNDNLDVI